MSESAGGYATIADAVAAVRSGETSASALVENAISIADALDEQVGMFLTRFSEQAMQTAKDIDTRLAEGAAFPPLVGIPIGVKDIITSSEAPTTAQSTVLDAAWSDGDAVVVARLRAAGAIIMGKLTTMEFALGIPDPDKDFPVPRNPWSLAHWAGGSSSGSGSAVATGAVLGALGTDTGGSIRIPAAYCGVTGLMPTFGRVPKAGCVPLGYTLDHVGPMARSARDTALLLGVLAGHDAADVSSADEPVGDYVAALSGDLTGVRIGVDRLARSSGEHADPALPAALDEAVAQLAARGAQLCTVELSYYDEMVMACTVIMQAEALAYHLPDLRRRWTDYYRATRTNIGIGALYSAADYVQAQRVRAMVMHELAVLFSEVDLIVTPTMSTGATKLDDLESLLPGGDGPGLATVHTPYWDPAGNPVLSVPIGVTSEGLPLGMQIAGRPFDEALVLRAGDAFQRATDWHLRVPPLAAIG